MPGLEGDETRLGHVDEVKVHSSIPRIFQRLMILIPQSGRVLPQGKISHCLDNSPSRPVHLPVFVVDGRTRIPNQPLAKGFLPVDGEVLEDATFS
jgi:hypothetical protein